MVIVDEYIIQPDNKLIIISDAFVHIANDTAAGAWQMYKNGDRDNKRRVLQPLEYQDHSYSYQYELETFILCSNHYNRNSTDRYILWEQIQI